MKICTPCIPSIKFSIIHASIKCSGFNLVLIVFWWNRGTRACTTALTFAWACSLLICEEFEIIKRGFFFSFLGFQRKRFWEVMDFGYSVLCIMCTENKFKGRKLRDLSYLLKNILCNKSLKKIHCTCNINIFVCNIHSPASLLRYTLLVLGWTALFAFRTALMHN